MLDKKRTNKRSRMTEGQRQIISSLISEFDIKTASDIQTALKELLGNTIQEMMEEEMSEHLGYNKSERSSTGIDYRNGYKSKHVISNFGKLSIV